MPNVNEQDQSPNQLFASEKEQQDDQRDKQDLQNKSTAENQNQKEAPESQGGGEPIPLFPQGAPHSTEGRPNERMKAPRRPGARGTAAMDPQTRKEVARKGGLAVSRNRQHMAEIGRKGGQTVSKNREHMAQIGRKGGAASRGHR